MYNYFVSLGWYCGVAASMEKLGLRSQSGPFDWYFSDYEGVLKCVENEFVDILDYNNLQTIKDKPLEFIDIKYNFHFNHELNKFETLNEMYTKILMKYKNRANRFLEMIKKPTCFIRAIRNEKEIQFILNNSEYISKIIKRSNVKNNVIYIVTEELKEKASFLNPFIIKRYDGNTKETLMDTFDQCNELVNYCLSNIDKNIHTSNLLFEMKRLETQLNISKIRYSLTNQLLKIKDNNIIASDNINKYSSNVIIYGAGDIGKSLFEELHTKMKVLCFIDQNNIERYYKNIPILKIEDIKSLYLLSTELIIIVTPVWDIRNIEKKIDTILNGMKYQIISIQDILNCYNTVY